MKRIRTAGNHSIYLSLLVAKASSNGFREIGIGILLPPNIQFFRFQGLIQHERTIFQVEQTDTIFHILYGNKIVRSNEMP